MKRPTPEAASPLPLEGAAPAAWQSQFRGARSHEMQRRNAKKGIASLCIGGGMGVALTVER